MNNKDTGKEICRTAVNKPLFHYIFLTEQLQTQRQHIYSSITFLFDTSFKHLTSDLRVFFGFIPLFWQVYWFVPITI